MSAPGIDQRGIRKIQDVVPVHELQKYAHVEPFAGNPIGKSAEQFGLGIADYLAIVRGNTAHRHFHRHK